MLCTMLFTIPYHSYIRCALCSTTDFLVLNVALTKDRPVISSERAPHRIITLTLWSVHVKYQGVIFFKRNTLRLHIETIGGKTFRTFIRIYSLFKSELLSANVKLILRKALITSAMTYACPAWELAADTCLLKLQCLQNKVLRTIGNFPSCTLVRDLHTAFKLQYAYDYITKLCRQQAEVMQNHENEHVGSIGTRRSQT
jgi:hypothetical protein